MGGLGDSKKHPLQNSMADCPAPLLCCAVKERARRDCRRSSSERSRFSCRKLVNRSSRRIGIGHQAKRAFVLFPNLDNICPFALSKKLEEVNEGRGIPGDPTLPAHHEYGAAVFKLPPVDNVPILMASWICS